MIDFSARFTRPDGSSSLNYLIELDGVLHVTYEDLLAIGQMWRTRIVEKTISGVDVDNLPFAPYSEKGPYYYNPSGQAGTGTVSLKQQKAAVKRLFKKVSQRGGEAGPHPSRTGRTIVFPGGYAQFKQWLGRTGVDLYGPRAPHMLQAIYVRSDSPDSVTLGIYGEPAARASGHQEGNPAKHLPQRRFLGADAEMMAGAKSMLMTRLLARTRGLSSGVLESEA